MNNINSNIGMSSRFGQQQFPQQSEAPNPLTLTYQNPQWPPNSIIEQTVLTYFCDQANTHFYDKTSDNEVVQMQSLHSLSSTRDLEAIMTRMNGIQYVLHKSRPPLFVIRKQKRNSPHSVNPLCYYYVLNGVVYQAPDLYSVVNSRIVGATEPLKTALSNVVDMLQYNPTKNVYSWKFKSEPSKKSKKSAEEKSESTEAGVESWDSRATPYQHVRTEMLLHLVREQFAEPSTTGDQIGGPSDQSQEQ